MARLRLAASLTAALILSSCADPAPVQPETPARARAIPLVDHHQHLRSPRATQLYYSEIYRGWGRTDTPDPVARDAEDLIGQLNEAGKKRAAVLSLAYWFGDPDLGRVPNAHQLVRAENEWTAAEAARFPDRLVAICSFNPLADYALRELEWCATSGKFRGLKLHFGNSEVDIRRPDHAQKVVRVFQAANAVRLPMVVHMWTEPAYEEEGAAHATAFLDRILPAAPDVPVQIAHLAGGGFTTETAFKVLADAIEANDPRTRNLYFDAATSVSPQLYKGNVEDLATRFRQVGMDRIFYGSDMSLAPREGWRSFQSLLPLSDEEIMDIADNVAPYMR
ncbi:MAG TPA: amidohydrolase family protein [Allosphingosinicella sp.]